MLFRSNEKNKTVPRETCEGLRAEPCNLTCRLNLVQMFYINLKILPEKSKTYGHQPQLRAQPDSGRELAKELDDKYLDTVQE